MFGLGIAPKETFLAYSTQFVFLIIRLVPGNVVMVAIDMCGKSPITGEWIYGITWKHVYFNIFVLFFVNTTSILKLVFHTVYAFCLDGPMAVLLPLLLMLLLFLFIYLLFFLSLPLLFLCLLSLLSLLLLLFFVRVIVAFCVCVWLLLLLI